MPAIPPHSTATSDKSWDGPAAKANLKNDGDEAYYRSAYAWEDSEGDKKTKAAYKFIHHEVSGDGKVGAANLTACSSGIAILNGGRAGADIPDGDRKGVWNHLARHLKDGGKEPPELKSIAEIEDLEAAAAVPDYPRILMAITGRPWAIMPDYLASIMQIVQHPIHGEAELAALAARMGRPLENGGNRVRDHNGTAVLDVEGPLFRYANVMTRVSGATSIQQLALDLRTAMDDSKIKSVVLSVNSPGGQVDGINELADMIREYGAEKPITAYVGGLGGSGGYWLASAAGRIVANESAQLGSIGVLATFVDNREAQRRQGVAQYDVVSSQSPLKRSDPATDEGRQQMQEMVDAMADLFIERVARFRSVTPDKVARDFGRGGILPARRAIAAGMADGLGSLEGLLRERQEKSTIPAQVPAGERPDKPVALTKKRQIGQDRPATDPPLQTPPPSSPGAPPASADAPFDYQELEEGTDDSTVNDQHDCTCPAGEPCECGNRKDDQDDYDPDEDKEDEEDDDKEDEEEDMPAKEERQRIAAIMNCEEAQGREDLARVLALTTNHSPERAKEILKAAPQAGSLKMRMGQLQNPTVGTGSTEEASAADEVKRILAFVPKHLKHASAQ